MLCLLLATGCASVASTPAAPAAEKARAADGAAAAGAITLCETPLAELERRLGAPSRDGLLHGQRLLSWITDWQPLVRYLAVLVDARGVVVDLYWDVPTEVLWTPANQCLARRP